MMRLMLVLGSFCLFLHPSASFAEDPNQAAIDQAEACVAACQNEYAVCSGKVLLSYSLCIYNSTADYLMGMCDMLQHGMTLNCLAAEEYCMQNCDRQFQEATGYYVQEYLESTYPDYAPDESYDQPPSEEIDTNI